ncbi:MAG: DNA-directed RNA polymerase subunit alpha C-terminal domain-containing protein, partial [Porcipelethomonas sp.]
MSEKNIEQAFLNKSETKPATTVSNIKSDEFSSDKVIDEAYHLKKNKPDFYSENGIIICGINGNRIQDQSIKKLGLTAKTYEILENADVKNISQLIDMTHEQLRSIKDIVPIVEVEILKKLIIFLVNLKEKSTDSNPAGQFSDNISGYFNLEENKTAKEIKDDTAENMGEPIALIEKSVTESMEGTTEEIVIPAVVAEKISLSSQTNTQNLPLSIRSKNSLCRAGIMNLGQLMECSDNELLKIRNLGAKSMHEIVDLKNSININSERTDIKSEEPVLENNEITEEIPFIKTDIWNLPLSVRSKNVLRRNGIMILEQLMNVSNDELKKFRNLGAKSFQEIVNYKKKIVDHLFDEELETTDVSGEKREICEQFINDLNISMSQADKIRPYCYRILMQCDTEDELLREWYKEPHVNDILKKKIYRLLS